jgi:hypothetical protein
MTVAEGEARGETEGEGVDRSSSGVACVAGTSTRALMSSPPMVTRTAAKRVADT